MKIENAACEVKPAEQPAQGEAEDWHNVPSSQACETPPKWSHDCLSRQRASHDAESRQEVQRQGQGSN